MKVWLSLIQQMEKTRLSQQSRRLKKGLKFLSQTWPLLLDPAKFQEKQETIWLDFAWCFGLQKY